ncbi:MAG: oligoendopeptidase F, partial [Chthoniobacterales bacterium]|nr:oligoendopeptidase F [Chthoniobacterales bacterium]
ETLSRSGHLQKRLQLIHAIEERGEALTLNVFKSEYRKLLEAYFGTAVVLDPELDLECLRIPHFYSAFYVYKYATGVSAAIALAERVLSGAPGAVEAYLGFLKSGGAKFPLETLQKAGVDMTASAPVESTLALFDRRVSELETLL